MLLLLIVAGARVVLVARHGRGDALSFSRALSGSLSLSLSRSGREPTLEGKGKKEGDEQEVKESSDFFYD